MVQINPVEPPPIRYQKTPEKSSDRLTRATTPREVGLILSEEIDRLVGFSAYNFVHFDPKNPISDGMEDVVYWNKTCTCDYNEFIKILPHTLKEYLDFPELMKPPKIFDVDRLFDKKYIKNTVSYNELWRKIHIERQIMLPLGTLKTPPWICLHHTAGNPTCFSQKHFSALARLRILAEDALMAINKFKLASHPPTQILNALATSLPDPTILLSPTGRVLWLNQEAQLWLEINPLRFGTRTALYTTSPKLRALKTLARKLAAQPQYRPNPQTLKKEGILTPYERLIWRSITNPGHTSPINTSSDTPRHILFCISNPTEPTDTKLNPKNLIDFGLSSREAEVTNLAAQGFTMINIATRLNISKTPSTPT